MLRSTSQQKASVSQLIQSYRLNLNALSLMASFVAVFIVYNSMLISVQQRAKSLGILRCPDEHHAELRYDAEDQGVDQRIEIDPVHLAPAQQAVRGAMAGKAGHGGRRQMTFLRTLPSGALRPSAVQVPRFG